jgi:hypothetical protein
VLSLIDQDEVARFVAFKDPAETPKEKAYKKEMKLQKSALISAIHNICKYGPAFCIGFQLNIAVCHVG